MQQTHAGHWLSIIDDVRLYPSPHNSQPIKIYIVDSYHAEVFYDLDLGLPAESYGIPFAHVCAGVFLESLRVVAAYRGFTINEELSLDELDFSSKKRLHKFATVELVKQMPSAEDTRMYEAFLSRQTNRRPYDNTVVQDSVIQGAQSIAQESGYVFMYSSDRKLVKELVHVNQATLFDDLQNDSVYSEIMHWLRFSHAQALSKGDGLSAETMLMPGRLLHFFMKHRSLWFYPGIGAVARNVYLNTMKGVRQLGWIEGPFNTTGEYINAGRTFMKIWLYFTQQNVSLHPFGTVITNPRSHKQFVEKAHITESDTSMAWMLFRFGYSKQPPTAFRRSAGKMLVSEELYGQNK